jgi:DNA modification methylase
MDGEKANAILTDPPYGINQDGVTNDEPAKLQGIVQGAIHNFPLSAGVVVAFQSTRTFPLWLDEIRSAGFHFERMLWLYKEAQCTFPWRGWILTSESILVAVKGEARWNEVNPYSHDCYKVSEVGGEISNEIGWHGSVKPLKVIADIASRITHKGDLIYDPFGGSGTTLIACERTHRKCRMIEIEPKYVNVILSRYEAETGKEAKLIERIN